MDADMTRRALDALGDHSLDLIFLALMASKILMILI